MYIQFQYKTNLFSVDRYVIKHFLQLCIAVKSGIRGVRASMLALSVFRLDRLPLRIRLCRYTSALALMLKDARIHGKLIGHSLADKS